MTNELAKTGGGALEKYRKGDYNVLTPLTRMTGIPDGIVPTWREVQIEKEQCYNIAGDTWGLGGVAIQQIAQMAGVSTVQVQRTDDRKHPHLSEYLVMVEVVDYDGTRRRKAASKVLDLRDDAGEGIKGGQLAAMIAEANRGDEEGTKHPTARIREGRKHIHQICSTMAELRAIAKITGMKRAYTVDELKRPFAVPKISLDPGDPDAKRAMLAAASGAQASLYGSPEPMEKRAEGATVVPHENDQAPKEIDPPTADEPSQAAQTLLDQTWEYSKQHKIGKTEFTRLFNEIGKEKAELTVNDVKVLAEKLSIRAAELASDDGEMPV